MGKSSLINALSRAKIARTSAAPGKTRLANIYRVAVEGGAGGPGRWAAYFVDLPGYGYAKIAKEKKAEWRPLIEQYLKYSRTLRGIVQLLDARRDPTDDDIAMLDFLADRGVPTIVAVTTRGLPFPTFPGVSVDSPVSILNETLIEQSGALGTGTFAAIMVLLLVIAVMLLVETA